MTHRDLGQAFLNREPIPGVLHSHNDYVRVVAGRYAGESGSLVTVLSLDPEPKFILESEGQGDIEVLQSELRRVEA